MAGPPCRCRLTVTQLLAIDTFPDKTRPWKNATIVHEDKAFRATILVYHTNLVL